MKRERYRARTALTALNCPEVQGGPALRGGSPHPSPPIPDPSPESVHIPIRSDPNSPNMIHNQDRSNDRDDH